ncbi:MAG: outer membrane beta-barrel domain-containing protein [Proteobacteria bacterium]|nr:outer membrane beta-barrel domain-containing protein [Pseudomonadota bacterium]
MSTLKGMACLVLLLPLFSEVYAQKDDRFDDFEIRVIRPKYFTKSFRLETGLQGVAIFNHPFIYTYMGHLNLTFHFNEALALEASGYYGLSLDRNAKTELNSKFLIQTIIHRTQHIGMGSILWTPFYGKFQTSANKLVYFDFFLTGGGGVTGISYQYDHCSQGEQTSQPKLSKKLVHYPTANLGGGQKVFLTKNIAIRWDILYMPYRLRESDGLCVQTAQPDTNAGASAQADKKRWKVNYVFKLGVSRFF